MHPYAPPPGAPPPRIPHGGESVSNTDDTPDEPPPAYTPAAGAQGDTSVQAGPSHVDFSGPPPSSTPSRLEHNITGVGIGYGRRPDPPNQTGSFSPQRTGNGGWGVPDIGGESVLPPPSHPSRLNDTLPTKSSSSRPPPPNDMTPTEAPTPGRPLLRNGQMLVYPVGYVCSKCEF